MTSQQKKIVEEIKEELMKERGKLLDILDAAQVEKIQIRMKSGELKNKVDALSALLKDAKAYNRRRKISLKEIYGKLYELVNVAEHLKDEARINMVRKYAIAFKNKIGE